jgi:hypothetical protein
LNQQQHKTIKKMKHVSLTLLAIMVFSITIHAQEQKAQMTAPVIFQGAGTMYFADGTVATGNILYEAITGKFVKITPTGGNTGKYKAKEVLRFTIGSSLWYVKTIKDALSASGNEYFVNLANDSSSKIKLYDYHEQDAMMPGGFAAYTKKTYVELPGAEKLYSPNNLYFMPFHKKMAEITADCPELSKKIADKEDGYKIKKMLGMPTNLETMVLKIIGAYNACNTGTAVNTPTQQP